ncbi:MAG TPA: hypothetical protein VGK35_13015 [Actinotalea sp.]|jgi:hypothetical protein
MADVPRSRRSAKRPWGQEHPDLDVERALGGRRTETSADGDWVVQSVPAGSSTKVYRCPGCQQEVTAGTAHLVAWATDSLLGADAAVSDRRHWHTACWRSRGRRR